MSSAEIRGRFVWHDLITTDSAGAGAFYPRIAGWKSEPWDKNPDYTLWVGKSGPMGGVMRPPEGEGGAPSRWMPYIGTKDLEGTIAAAQEQGARICKEITPIPGAGRFAVLADPQGATFAVYAAGEGAEGGAAKPPQVGEFSWHELATTDIEAALDFYAKLFGWGKGPAHDMGAMGVYQLFTLGGKQVGGIYRLNPQVSEGPHWLCYVRVSDVDRAAHAAKEAGGRIVNGPMEVPGGDWIAQIVDPQGAAFAVHEVKPLASGSRTAKAPPQAAKRVARKVARKKKKKKAKVLARGRKVAKKRAATRRVPRKRMAKKKVSRRVRVRARKRR
jgi:predicted enzyme related to lactoylglutathione lyase